MFMPETLLKQKKLDPPSMSGTEIAEAISQLAAEARPYASFEYYVQILGAIRILAEALQARH